MGQWGFLMQVQLLLAHYHNLRELQHVFLYFYILSIISVLHYQLAQYKKLDLQKLQVKQILELNSFHVGELLIRKLCCI